MPTIILQNDSDRNIASLSTIGKDIENIDQIGDVVITSPINNDILVYDDSILSFINASIYSIDMLYKRTVEITNQGVSSPNILVSTDTNKVLSNDGSTEKNYHTLPSADTGLTYTFIVQDSNGIRITASEGDTIRISSVVSAIAGYIDSEVVGSTVTLVAINSTEWIATSVVGTWTIT